MGLVGEITKQARKKNAPFEEAQNETLDVLDRLSESLYEARERITAIHEELRIQARSKKAIKKLRKIKNEKHKS